MKIILNEDVYNLGEEGDVCDVARGYARNYLFPRELAVPYTKENISIFESRKAAIEKRKEEKRKSAQSLRERLEGKELVIPMNAGETGKLFGSVTNAMIVEQLAAEGIELEKKQIDVPSNTIKMTGTYSIRVRLYENETAEITIKVVNQNKPESQQTETEQPAATGEAPAESESETAGGAGEESAEIAGEESAEAEPAGEESAEIESAAEEAAGDEEAAPEEPEASEEPKEE